MKFPSRMEHRYMFNSWLAAIQRAIVLGNGDAARLLTIGWVRRLRECNYPV